MCFELKLFIESRIRPPGIVIFDHENVNGTLKQIGGLENKL
jgi:hypothetical protein